MQFHEMFHDGEAEAEASRLSRRRSIFLPESLENVPHKFRRDALARVGDGDGRLGARAGRADDDLSARGCEFHGVAQQIPNDLLEPVRVGLDRLIATGSLREKRNIRR